MTITTTPTGAIRFRGIANRTIILMPSSALAIERARAQRELHIIKFYGVPTDPTYRKERHCLQSEVKRIDAELSRRAQPQEPTT